LYSVNSHAIRKALVYDRIKVFNRKKVNYNIFRADNNDKAYSTSPLACYNMLRLSKYVHSFKTHYYARSRTRKLCTGNTKHYVTLTF